MALKERDIDDVVFTGIVVTYNEEKYLSECLESLEFCEQLVVVDLGSTDQSVEIAKTHRAEVFKHKWVPVVEQVWPYAVSLSKSTWIVRADPDEIFQPSLLPEIIENINSIKKLAVIELPHQYFFRGVPLDTTIWGGIKYIPKMFHKQKVVLKPYVHHGIKVLDGYERIRIQGKKHTAIKHLWIDSYREFLTKHWRYIKQEGGFRYTKGDRFSWKATFRETTYSVLKNLIEHHSVRGGLDGIGLTVLYAWYVGMCHISLRQHQKRKERALR